jgi:ligand-binding sensor protein
LTFVEFIFTILLPIFIQTRIIIQSSKFDLKKSTLLSTTDRSENMKNNEIINKSTGIQLQDVLDIDLLQRFQDNFAESMDIASVTVDMNGAPVTKPSSYTSFCIDYTHKTRIGDERCAESHKKGGDEAARTGRPYIYKCHAGLIDFAAPIMVDGILIGTILGGQILTVKPEEDGFRVTAKEIGVNEDQYIEDSKRIREEG